MPSYFPENNTPLADDTEVRSLQKINALLGGGITVSVGEVEIKNDAGNPVPVTGLVNVGSSATVSDFTSTSSAQIAEANANRDLLTVYNEGAGILYVLFGSGTASASNYTTRLYSGDYLEVERYSGQVNGIFATAGTARVTVVS